MHICCAAHGGLVGHRPVTPHTPGCYVGAGCSAWARAVQVRCLSLEVLCEWCASSARGGTMFSETCSNVKDSFLLAVMHRYT